MNEYTKLLEEKKSLVQQVKEIDENLSRVRDMYTEKAREQNWNKIHAITDEEKRVLLKFVEHEGGTCRLQGVSAWRQCSCPRCRLEDILSDGENYWGNEGFTIHANVSTITWEDYKE